MDKNMFPSEPTLNLRRNAFYHKNDEIRLRDSTIIELLYFEAKHNILVGKYPCSDVSEAIFFASLVARINLGNFVPQQHNPYFFRYQNTTFILYFISFYIPFSLYKSTISH